jgi:regulator of nucleoside diphosphate kinase
MNDFRNRPASGVQPCRLTTKDRAILETMLERCREPHGEYAALLRRKLAGARLWLGGDIPAGVVTMNSRVIFRVDGGPLQTRIVAQSPVVGMVGLLLPVTSLRGLALLGLAEGESIRLGTGEASVCLTVEAVAYQPEAAQREAERQREHRPRLRLVHDAGHGPAPAFRPAFAMRGPDGDDDPGPSAA